MRLEGEKEMHIAYVTPEFVMEHKGGGLASYLSNIARILADYGHMVTVIVTSDNYNNAIQWYPNVIVESVKNNGKSLPVPLYNLWRSWKLCRRVQKVNKRRKIDVVQYSSFEAVGFFCRKNIPAVVRISSDRVCWREYKVLDYTEQDLERLYLSDKIEYTALKRMKYIYGPSYATAKIVSKRIGQDISVIESPFYLKKTEFDDSLYKEKLEGKKYYLSHSSMSCLKGTHVIAQVIEKVCCQDEEAYFVFVGSDHGIFYRDGQKECVKEYIIRTAGQFSDKVIFLGTLQRETLFPIIENAYMCLMPSRIDNMPNTCIEAMAMGKVIVGTRGASYEQLIEDNVSGYLVEVDNPEEMKKAIDNYNQLDDVDKKRMGEEAKEVTKRFEPEAIYNQIINYYMDILKRMAEK